LAVEDAQADASNTPVLAHADDPEMLEALLAGW